MPADMCPTCESPNVIPVVLLRCNECGQTSDPSLSGVQGRLARIRSVLAATSNEHELRRELSLHLRELRRLYKIDKQPFSEDDIEFLREAGVVLEALEELTEVLEGIESLPDVLHAADALEDLDRIARAIGPLPVQQRVLREMRALRERFPRIDDSTLKQQERRSQSILRLERDAPPCPCGARAVLRESRLGFFWGCSTFPECWKKRPLKRQEAEALGD